MVKRKLEAAVPKLAKKIAQFVAWLGPNVALLLLANAWYPTARTLMKLEPFLEMVSRRETISAGKVWHESQV